MHWDSFDTLPAEERFATYIAQALEERQGNYDEELLSLSKVLGFTRPQTVVQWIRGTAKVPIHHLVPISRYLHHDLSRTLPLWLAAEAAHCDGEEIYLVAKRCLTVWEFAVIQTCRSVYGIYDLEEDSASLDEDE